MTSPASLGLDPVSTPPMVGPQPESKPTLGFEGRFTAGKRSRSRAAVEAR